MTNGIVCFANDNGQVDYLKQAVNLAKRAKKYLKLPVSVVTDQPDRVYERKLSKHFDNVIHLPLQSSSHKEYYDGSFSKKQLEFRNSNRAYAYDITPYDNTLVLDTDFIICSDNFKNIFDAKYEFQIYSDSCDLAQWRDTSEFNYINDTGIKFYWATCMFFKKTETNKIFFDLVTHIAENWEHYHLTYNLGPKTFRNDFAFSIAIHLMNLPVASLPGKMLYTLDRDLIIEMKNQQLKFLLEKENIPGEYTLAKTDGLDIHVMNKFSLGRVL